jgi:FtsH-binding integral membrane protein
MKNTRFLASLGMTVCEVFLASLGMTVWGVFLAALGMTVVGGAFILRPTKDLTVYTS